MSERLRNRIKQELILLSVAVIIAKKKVRDARAEQAVQTFEPSNTGDRMKMRIPTLHNSMDKLQVAITTLLLPYTCSMGFVSDLLMSMTKPSVDANKAVYEQALTHFGQRLELALQKYNFAMVQASFGNVRQLLTFTLPPSSAAECSVLNLLKVQKEIFHVILLVISYAVQPKSPDSTADSGRILHDKVNILCSVARDGIIQIIKRYEEADLQFRADTGLMTVDHSLKMIAQEWSLRLLADTIIKTHHCFPVSSALHCIAEDIEFGMETS